MASKQILSVIEINDNRAILVTGEFLNSRLNILKVDEEKIEGVENGLVINSALLCTSLKNLVERSSRQLNIAIQKAILIIPDFSVKRVHGKATTTITNSDRRITAFDIRRTIKEAIRGAEEPDSELVNVITPCFFVNKVPYDDPPIGEIADLLEIEIDLLYADRKVTHQYVAACEKSGLKVIDICLSSYAAAKEMALFEESENKVLVTINLQESYTSLAIFLNNRLLKCVKMSSGYGAWLQDIVSKTGIETEEARKLCREALELDDYRNQTTVYYSEDKDDLEGISQGKLNQEARNGLNKWIETLASTCSRLIADKGQVVYYLYGDCCDIKGISERLKEELKAEKVSIYIPGTIGVRDSLMTAVLGAFYVYSDSAYLLDKLESSIDMAAFNKIISESYIKPERKITEKIKNIFLRTDLED